jgi:hypothetical protein
MSLKNFGFAHWMQRLDAALSLTLPTTALREGSDELASSQNGFPDADVSSLSIALYQMGLCKHLPDPGTKIDVSPIA